MGKTMKIKLLLLLSCVLLSGCYIQSLNKFYTDDRKVELPQIEGAWLPTVQIGQDVSNKNISPWVFTEDKIESYDVDNKFAELEVVYFKIDDSLFMDFSAGKPFKDTKEQFGNFFWRQIANHPLKYSLHFCPCQKPHDLGIQNI